MAAEPITEAKVEELAKHFAEGWLLCPWDGLDEIARERFRLIAGRAPSLAQAAPSAELVALGEAAVKLASLGRKDGEPLGIALNRFEEGKFSLLEAAGAYARSVEGRKC